MNATSRAIKAHADKLEAELAEALYQVQQTQIDRDTWRSNYHEVAAQIEAKERELSICVPIAQLAEARHQIAELTKKANFNEGLRDVAMRDRGRMEAALTHIINECSRFPIKDGLAFRCESIALNALAAPARETEL